MLHFSNALVNYWKVLFLVFGNLKFGKMVYNMFNTHHKMITKQFHFRKRISKQLYLEVLHEVRSSPEDGDIAVEKDFGHSLDGEDFAKC